MIQGRLFDDRDTDDAPRVAIVHRRFVACYLGDHPLGLALLLAALVLLAGCLPALRAARTDPMVARRQE